MKASGEGALGRQTMLEALCVGEKAIYPSHGAGVVEAIEKKVISGKEQLFYVMRIFRNNARIMIPMAKVQSVGVRKPISPDEADTVCDILRGGVACSSDPPPSSETWNRKYNRYKLLIRSGSVQEIAGLLKLLHTTNKARTLSLGERILVERAMDLLVGELMCVRDLGEEDVRTEIEKLLTKD